MAVKIYTRTGDKGKTGLFSGERVEKDDVRVKAYGSVDELNSILGWCLVIVENDWLKELIDKLQNQLFILGGDLATPPIGKWAEKVKRIDESYIEFIERYIDKIENELSPLKEFILPGGSELASRVHIARVVCRRAERDAVRALRERRVNPMTVQYLNRLSDLLFVLARYINQQGNITERVFIG
ncbi:MAG: cob(I)yrinic acid a,c-diamide adenosyltransferase [Deltaproteobacteria bacterium]|nr:MAG: cob(I)yrinic acid a,c-diamide adenosyltransferase [Deltaproteobacteria bacterium]